MDKQNHDRIPSCLPVITSTCDEVKWKLYFKGISTLKSSKIDSWSAVESIRIPAVAKT